jgi:mediator of RNA polymerase II transcription subunit 6
MQQMAEISKNMTHWTPATGYSYFPPSHEANKAATTSASRIGSPTLAPTDPADMAGSQSQAAGAPTQVTDPVASETEFSDALFMHSLNLTNAYGDEYMDENPLKGEPGAFVFEASRTAINARNKAQEQAAQLPAALKIDTQPASVAPSVVATPKATTTTATPTTAEGPSRKGSVAPSSKKKKDKDRRKSQAGLASPTTPSVP